MGFRTVVSPRPDVDPRTPLQPSHFPFFPVPVASDLANYRSELLDVVDHDNFRAVAYRNGSSAPGLPGAGHRFSKHPKSLDQCRANLDIAIEVLKRSTLVTHNQQSVIPIVLLWNSEEIMKVSTGSWHPERKGGGLTPLILLPPSSSPPPLSLLLALPPVLPLVL